MKNVLRRVRWERERESDRLIRQKYLCLFLCEKVHFSLSDPFKFLPKYPKILSIPSIFFQQMTEPKKSNFIRLATIDFWILFCSCVLSKLFFFSFDSSNKCPIEVSKRRLEKFDNFWVSTRDLCRSTTFKRVRKKRSNHQTHAPFTSSSSSSVSTTATHVYWWSWCEWYHATTTTTTSSSSSSSLLLSLHRQNENDSVDGAPPGVLLFTKQSKERSFRFWTTTRSTKTTHRITERRSNRT